MYGFWFIRVLGLSFQNYSGDIDFISDILLK